MSVYKQSDLPVEYLRVNDDRLTPSLLIWRRYKLPYPGMLEIFLDLNPEVCEDMMASPFIPVGTIVRIPISSDILGRRPNLRQISLTGGD